MGTEFSKIRLGKKEQKFYSEICSALKAGKNKFRVSNGSIQEMQEAFEAIHYDHPELFYLSNQFNLSWMNQGFYKESTFSTDFIYTSSQIKDIKEKMSKTVTSLSLHHSIKTIEATLTYLVENTHYAINDRYNQNAASALYFHEAQCSGFAKAFKLVCDENKIISMLVIGEILDQKTGTWGAHAWNIVYLNGKYYHVDPTGVVGSNQDKVFSRRSYLFWSDFQMKGTHRWDRKIYPVCEYYLDPSLNKISKMNEETVPTFKRKEEVLAFFKNEFRQAKTEYIFSYDRPLNNDDKLNEIMEAVDAFLEEIPVRGYMQAEYFGNCFKANFYRQGSSIFEKIFRR